MLAAKLGWHLLDSGSLYRVTAFACLHDGVGLEDEDAVAEVARHLDVGLEIVGGLQRRNFFGQGVGRDPFALHQTLISQHHTT